jgi:methyl-accepting chemotaxis protein
MKLRNKMALCMAMVFLLFMVALGVAVSAVGGTGARFDKFIEQDQAFVGATSTLYARGLQIGQALRNIILAPAEPQGYKNLAAAREEFRKALPQAQALVAGDAVTSERLAKIESWHQGQSTIQDKIVALAKQDQAGAIALLNSDETPLWRKIRAELLDILKARNASVDTTKVQLSEYIRRMLTISLVLAAGAVVVGAGVSFWLTRSIMRQLGGEPSYAAAIAGGVAGGNLTADIIVDDEANTASLMYAMRTMQRSLAALVAKVRSGTETIATASGEIAAGNIDLSARTEEQASSLEETASSMEELTSTVQQNADSVRQANLLAARASEVALKGGEVVGQVVQTMCSINESATRIADIIGVIDGIAFQTNILALNAAVEAARAGEQGRGFAVVASEVRNLAQRSAAAAKEIKGLIGDSVARVDAGSKLVNMAGETMDEVVASVKRVADIMGEIDLAGQEQSAGIAQVNQAIAQMDQVSQQNAALVEEAAAAADSMQIQAQQLSEVVSTFRLTQSSDSGARPIDRLKTRIAPSVRPVIALHI